jgi:hypothetical protein
MEEGMATGLVRRRSERRSVGLRSTNAFSIQKGSPWETVMISGIRLPLTAVPNFGMASGGRAGRLGG